MSTIAFAILAGIAVLLAGSLPWVGVPGIGGLASWNLRALPTVPWAIVPMALYLWAYWKYISGRIGSTDSSKMRQANLRANPLSADVWGMALITGLIGFGALLALLGIMARLVTMPPSARITMPEGMPAATSVLLLAMSSIVAGITEEAGFRGYMQGPIERGYGPAAGILVNGVMFGLMHFPNHPSSVLTMLPYYIGVSAVYGGLTWATNSILPGLVLHAGGNIFSLTRLWITGRPEWQIAERAPTLIRDTGGDAAFIVSVIACLTFGGLTAWLCTQMRREQ